MVYARRESEWNREMTDKLFDSSILAGTQDSLDFIIGKDLDGKILEGWGDGLSASSFAPSPSLSQEGAEQNC